MLMKDIGDKCLGLSFTELGTVTFFIFTYKDFLVKKAFLCNNAGCDNDF